MKVSLSSRVWLGIVAGIIGALITGLVLAIFGAQAGIFGATLSVSLLGSIVVGAIIGLIFGLIVNPTRNYVQATLSGLVLGLVLWVVLALVTPLFIRTAAFLTGFNLASLVSLLVFGVITSLSYSLIGNAFYSYEAGQTGERPAGTMGGEKPFYRKRKEHRDYNDRDKT